MENRNWSTATIAEFSKTEEAHGPQNPRVIAASERGGINAAILSRREIQVLEHIREGMKNPEVAEILELSTKTVENHVRNILLKLAVKNRTQAVVQALRRSIITF